MPTYDYTGDGNAVPQWDAHQNFVTYRKVLKAADIIAADTTLTANGVIAAGDIIQAIDVPAGFICLGTAVHTVTAEGAALTADVGLAGGDEFQDGFSLNGTAGDIVLTLVGDDYGANNVMGVAFTAADTIDVKFTSETDAGEWVLTVFGVQLDLLKGVTAS